MATQGFEPFGKTSGEEVFYLPGDPGVTYTRGDHVAIGGAVSESSPTAGAEGVLLQVAQADTNACGVVHRTTVCPAASQPFPKSRDLDPVYNEAEDKTLVPVKLNVASGEQIYLATIASYDTDTVISYTEATRAIAATTGNAADDYPNGGLMWITAGDGVGQLNVVEDYDHAGGAASLLVITHRAFDTDPAAGSTYGILSGEGAASTGISLLGRCDRGDTNNLVANQGADDGEYIIWADWFSIQQHLANPDGARVPVIRRTALYS